MAARTLHMQQHRGSLAGDMVPGVRASERRHSACDILLSVLLRRRGSAIETLSSSSHRVMVAVSEEEIPAECKSSLCAVLGYISLYSQCLMSLLFFCSHCEDPHGEVHQDGGDPEARHPGSHAVLHGLWRESL